jgi:hypothetical protein
MRPTGENDYEYNKQSYNDNIMGGEEDFKPADFEKIANEKPYIPTLIEIDLNTDFGVFKPRLQSGHIVYMVRGVDKQGPWEGQRRFN